MEHSKVMWGCVAVLALAAILSVAGASGGYLLIAVPCMLMMGAMMWMLVGRGMGESSRGGDE
jgi:hypothetical protein